MCARLSKNRHQAGNLFNQKCVPRAQKPFILNTIIELILKEKQCHCIFYRDIYMIQIFGY